MTNRQLAWTLLFSLLTGIPLYGADNELTQREREAGWLLLFDGKTQHGWKAVEGSTGELSDSKRPVEDGTINPRGCGGYMLIYEQPFEDFILKLDLRLGPGHGSINSGIFIRTYPLQPRAGYDVGFNGIEIAVDSADDTSYVDAGAIYDLARPLVNNIYKPVGEGTSKWNHVIVTSHENLITVVMNDQLLTVCDLDKFVLPGKRPDGSDHKFVIAMKDHPRKGYIGLQDHGGECNYKNIKLLPLSKNP